MYSDYLSWLTLCLNAMHWKVTTSCANIYHIQLASKKQTYFSTVVGFKVNAKMLRPTHYYYY